MLANRDAITETRDRRTAEGIVANFECRVVIAVTAGTSWYAAWETFSSGGVTGNSLRDF
jgi:hypothetical protein